MRLPTAALFLIALATGCDQLQRAASDPADTTLTFVPAASDTMPGDSIAAPTGRTIQAGGMLEQTGYVTLDSVAFDIDRDGHRELITLAATVERSATGEPLWEDGHHWALVARHASTQYVLLEEFIPWGTMRFWVTRPETGGATRILVLSESGNAGNGSVILRDLRFDDGGRVYTVTDSTVASGTMARSTMVGR